METTFKANYNRKSITKKAWSFVQKQGISFSEAMKQAWFLAKRAVAIERNEFMMKLSKAGLLKLEAPKATSCPNQSDFSACETRKVTGFRQSTIAR